MSRKRSADDTSCNAHLVKRVKSAPRDYISHLSDELIVRIFSLLPVEILTTCQSVSHRLSRVAGDNVLWKAAYYEDFMRPRIARLLRKTKQINVTTSKGSSRISKLVEEEELPCDRSETVFAFSFLMHSLFQPHTPPSIRMGHLDSANSLIRFGNISTRSVTDGQREFAKSKRYHWQISLLHRQSSPVCSMASYTLSITNMVSESGRVRVKERYVQASYSQVHIHIVVVQDRRL